MIGDVFSSKMQSVLYDLMVKMLEKISAPDHQTVRPQMDYAEPAMHTHRAKIWQAPNSPPSSKEQPKNTVWILA